MEEYNKKECLADFLNVRVEDIFFDQNLYYHQEKTFIICTPVEAETWSKVILRNKLFEFPVENLIPFINLTHHRDLSPNEYDLLDAIKLVFNYGNDAQKQAFILQLLNPSSLEKFLDAGIAKYKENSERGFGPLFAVDEKQHYSRQYNLFLYRVG